MVRIQSVLITRVCQPLGEVCLIVAGDIYRRHWEITQSSVERLLTQDCNVLIVFSVIKTPGRKTEKKKQTACCTGWP